MKAISKELGDGDETSKDITELKEKIIPRFILPDVNPPRPKERCHEHATNRRPSRELCRQGQFEAAQKDLFAEDAVSIDA